MSNTIKDLALSLESKRNEMKAHLDSLKGRVPTSDELGELEKREAELAEIKGKYDAAKRVEDLSAENDEGLSSLRRVGRLPIATTDETASAVKTIGQMFVESDAYKHYRDGKVEAKSSIDVDSGKFLKTVFSSGAGFAPFVERSGVVAYSAVRNPSLLDVLPTISTDQNAYKFMLESTFTNNAAEKAESVEGTLTTFGESALAFTETTAAIKMIGTFLPVSEEQLEDVPGIQGLLDNRLGLMLRLRLESEVVAGSGTGANLQGIQNMSGVQAQALSTDTILDAVFKAITKVRANAFCEPSAVLIHPTDWQTITLAKDTVGQYLHHASAIGGPMTLWGVPVIPSTAMTAGTALVLDASQFAIVMRRGVDLQIGTVNANFTQAVKTIRATLRAGVVGYRPSAACKVTGL